MLLIKTTLKEAGHKGLGVFADEPIKAAQIIWRYEDVFCKEFTNAEVAKMAALQQEFIKKYATPEDGFWYLDLDNTRFMNHSNDNNIDFTDGWEIGLTVGIALRDIPAGEEITCDYRHLNVDINGLTD